LNRTADGNILNEPAESRLLTRLVVVSAVIHFLFLFIDPALFFWSSKPIQEEMVISADIFPDIDMGSSKEAALPEAQPAEELKVDKNLLPQLPNKFSIEEQEPKKDDMALTEEKPPEKEKAEEPPKEEKKAEDPDIVKKKNEEVTELKKQDALERLLKEQARKEEKFAEQTAAPLSKKLAQRKMDLENQRNGVSGGGGVSEIRLHKYLSSLSRVVKRNYALPQIYNLENANLEVRVAMMLNDNGDLRQLDIAQSSGDASFDQLVLKVIRDSVPLPRPPTELSGQTFVFVFSPRTM
jgi:TonB family protein